jgi:hypothetical protein
MSKSYTKGERKQLGKNDSQFRQIRKTARAYQPAPQKGGEK